VKSVLTWLRALSIVLLLPLIVVAAIVVECYYAGRKGK
jgi:hypothetical protein